ncbi:hypothetical protein [Streptomyces noursei]|uniref:hypothetical protein n=1 Tax=Streptomyces noursei TaxID=1971 RepID=UPI0023B853AE|nr:hypothetical protein [Streptomyces noursei]
MTAASEAPHGTPAGTVGRDVMTVHTLTRVDGKLRPKCGDGAPGDEVQEWTRKPSCPYCLNDEQAPRP